METLGQYLKREREFRQITLPEIAAATRINLASLQALEEDRCDSLAGEVFVRGYLKSYARHVGLDFADVLLRYEQWRESEGKKTKGEELAAIHLNKGATARAKTKYVWILLFAAALIGLAAYLSSR